MLDSTWRHKYARVQMPAASIGRRYTRCLYAVLMLSIILVATVAHPLDQTTDSTLERKSFDGDVSQQELLLPLQERYTREIEKYSRLFQSFRSTINRIKPFLKSKNPHLTDNPRLKDRSDGPTPKIYRPYPDYQSKEWKDSHRGAFVPCIGPRGVPVTENLDDQVSAYIGIPQGFPSTLFGSHEAVGWNGHLSFDRYTRYGAYGFGEDESIVKNWVRPSKVDWNDIDWGNLQNRCAESNAGRFSSKSTAVHSHISPERRTAILIRSYTGKVYSDDDIVNIRAMIMELALQSGGEYEVILLVHVQDDTIPLDDDATIDWLLEENIPPELWSITRFWSVATMASRYLEIEPELKDAHHSQWFPLQQFMLENPQFEYFWNWEIDSRFTGHYYEFVDRTATFGQKQPRRGIWERSERFYIPTYHGNYENHFRAFVDAQSPSGVWGPVGMGPQSIGDEVQRLGPKPPVSGVDADNFQWGVGEQADLMVFLPIFNPAFTEWESQSEVYGYFAESTTRRAALITHCRISRRLLMAMDQETQEGRHMAVEMFHVSTALIHGFKALSVPHPIYSDRLMPGDRVSRWFNSGIDGRSGSSKDSAFSRGRESRFRDVSWYTGANLPGRLYWNFLGWEKDGTGGPKYERVHGRHCLPSILFHPVRDVHPNTDSTHYKFDTDE